MAKKISAIVSCPGFKTQRVYFEECDHMGAPMVAVWTKQANHGLYEVSRFGDVLSRDWVRRCWASKTDVEISF